MVQSVQSQKKSFRSSENRRMLYARRVVGASRPNSPVPPRASALSQSATNRHVRVPTAYDLSCIPTRPAVAPRSGPARRLSRHPALIDILIPIDRITTNPPSSLLPILDLSILDTLPAIAIDDLLTNLTVLQHRVRRQQRLHFYALVSQPFDALRWWLIRPGRIEFVLWLIGTLLLLGFTVVFIFALARL